MFRRFLLTAAVAAVATLAAPATSRADFTLMLSDGSNSVTLDVIVGTGGGNVTDTYEVTNATGSFTSLINNTFTNSNTSATVAVGVLNFYNGSFIAPGSTPGIFTNTSTGTTQINSLDFDGFLFSGNTVIANTPGTSLDGSLQLTNTTLTNVAGPTTNLTIMVNQGGYTAPTGPVYLASALDSLTSTELGTVGETGTSVFTNPFAVPTTQTLTSSGTQVFSPAPFINPPGTYSLQGSVTVSDVGLSELGSSVDVTNFGINTELYGFGLGGPGPFGVVTPAPSGLIVAATMVPFFGLLRRRLSRTPPVVA